MKVLLVLNAASVVLTCIFSRKPAWLKELRLRAIVINMDATIGVLAKFKHSNAIPGPMKPIDCH